MGKKFSILVADKNKNVRDFIKRELCAEGYEASAARDGAEVMLEISKEHPPDLLILDLEIPDLNPSTVFKKAHSLIPPLPIIVHTFLTEESERLNQTEAELYIEKSGNIDHLKSAVAEMLGRFDRVPERA